MIFLGIWYLIAVIAEKSLHFTNMSTYINIHITQRNQYYTSIISHIPTLWNYSWTVSFQPRLSILLYYTPHATMRHFMFWGTLTGLFDLTLYYLTVTLFPNVSKEIVADNSWQTNLDDFILCDSVMCTPEDCLALLPECSLNISVLSQNIRSVGANFSGLLTLMERIKYSFDVIVLSECWLSCNIGIPVIDGYNSYKTTNNYNQVFWVS